jgi:hypothetical protein
MRRLAALLISTFLLWLSWHVVQADYGSRKWIPVTGVVAASQRLRDFKDYRPLVRYRYAVGGRTYEGGNRHANQPWPRTNIGTANEVVAKYHVGSPVTVFYDPANPAESAVEPGLTWGDFVLPLLGFIFLGIAVFAKGSGATKTPDQGPTAMFGVRSAP